jgi:hypothetical protein
MGDVTMTARWTIDDNGGEIWLVSPQGIYYSPTSLGLGDEPDTYDALVADVRAARLADDMAAAIRELHDPDPRGYCIACGWKAPCATRQMVDGFVPPGAAAAPNTHANRR